MFSVHTDNEKKQLIIEDRNGQVFAKIDLNPDQPILSADNLPAHQRILWLCRAANVGLEETNRAKREIHRLEGLIEMLAPPKQG